MTKQEKLETIDKTLKLLNNLIHMEEVFNLTADEMLDVIYLQSDFMLWKAELEEDE